MKESMERRWDFKSCGRSKFILAVTSGRDRLAVLHEVLYKLV
jgi:hypothetical protein